MIAKAMPTSTSNISVEDSNVQGKMPLKDSVSNKTNQALSKPTLIYVFSDRTNSVFPKTHSFRTKSSTAVHTLCAPKAKLVPQTTKLRR